MSALKLGNIDTGKLTTESERFNYLSPYHQEDIASLTKVMKFRDDDFRISRNFEEIPGNFISELQEFLRDRGFMPRGVIDGVYDYVTQAAVRLFQEYVRKYDIEGDPGIIPNGIVDEYTKPHLERWQKDKNKICDWAQWSEDKPTAEYTAWLALLNKAKMDFSTNPHPILKQVEQFNRATDTRKVSEWEYKPNEVHLLGIRVDEEGSYEARENNDLFILLIKGMVFKFWGSTDPSQAMAYNKKEKKGRFDEAFLVEGQHKYRFGWHNSDYRALKPYSTKYPVGDPRRNGVLVFRDENNDNALTQEDLNKGLDPTPNDTINIHWSGIGKTNFSAGCQVISGQSYINHNGENVDCKHFAGYGNGQLGDGKYTKAAYNLLADLIVCYSNPGVDHILYTLGRDGSLDLDSFFGVENYVESTIAKMEPKLN